MAMGEPGRQDSAAAWSSVAADVLPALAEGADVSALYQWLYPELRRLASRAMRGERAGHTLQTTALVNEAYLKLAAQPIVLRSRGQFLALCARMMRHVLIDHARSRDRHKRGGGLQQVTLNEQWPAADGQALELLALDQALAALQQLDARRAQLLECQLFAGMSYPEMAEALAVSEATVHRELRLARAWLQRELAEGQPHPPAA